jgi:hypothetical protein
VQFRSGAGIRAWDNVYSQNAPDWLQLKLTDATVHSGKPAYVARSVDTDDLDLYLVQPAILAADGGYVPPAEVEGVLIPRSQVSVTSVFSRKKAASMQLRP